jgi:ATP-dependent RNA helicase DeaD
MLRVIERATRQNIEAMQMPSIEDVNERRVARFNEKLTTAIESGAGQMFLPIIESYERDHNVSAADIAAALASIAQGATPLLLDPEPSRGSAPPYRAENETSERDEAKAGRGKPRQREWVADERRPVRRERPERDVSKRRDEREPVAATSEAQPDSAWGRKRPSAQAEAPTQDAQSDRTWSRKGPPAQSETPLQDAQPKLLNRRERRALERAGRESEGTPQTQQHEAGTDAEGNATADAARTATGDATRPKRERTRANERAEEGSRSTARGERQRDDRSPDSVEDTTREPAGRGGGEDVETYRIEVGHEHGVKPNNIVGAIANEVGLEGRFIGRVVIQEDHSFVDLPSGMPKEVFRQLQKVRVAGQPLQISRALKTHVEKLRRERPKTTKFKGKPERGAQRSRKK